MRQETENTNAEIILSLMHKERFTGIVAIYSRPWIPFSRHKFGLEYLSEHGIRVWTTSPEAALDYLVNFHQKNTLVYLITPLSLQTWRLYHTISRLRYKYFVRHTGLLPGPSRKVTPSLGSIKAWISQRISGFMAKHHNLFGIAPADFFLGGGQESFNTSPYPVGSGTQYLNGHAPDYDTYIELARNRLPEESARIAVFLDSDDFHHPDLKQVGRVAPPWEEAYYARLRRFLDTIENILKVRVVIAAHPLSRDIDVMKFGSREIIQGYTGNLVARSTIVITHASTATNLGVLFEKPILFITDKDYENYYIGPWIESIASALGKKPVYIDRPVDLSTAMDINSAAYSKYIEKYIMTRNPPVTCKEIGVANS